MISAQAEVTNRNNFVPLGMQQKMYVGKQGKNIQETSEDNRKEYGKHCKIWRRDKNLDGGSISVDLLKSGDIIKKAIVGSTTLMRKKTS